MPNDKFALWLLKTKPVDPAATLESIRELLGRAGSVNLPVVEEPIPSADPGPPPVQVTLPPSSAPAELVAAIQRYFPPGQWANALAVSHGESGWRATAENNTLHIGPCGTRYFIQRLGIWAQTEDSIGYFQINICAHGGSKELWYNADNNVRKAAELWHSAGWHPWAVTAGGLGLLT